MGNIAVGVKKTVTVRGTNLIYAFDNDFIQYDYGKFDLTPGGKYSDTEVDIDVYGDDPAQNCTIFAHKLIIQDGEEINIGELILFKYNIVD